MAAGGEIRIIVFREGNLWVAQCLEHDIGAQAEQIDALKRRVICAVEAELQASLRAHGVPFAGIPPAPAYFQRKWTERCEAVGEFGVTTLRADSRSVDVKMALAA